MPNHSTTASSWARLGLLFLALAGGLTVLSARPDPAEMQQRLVERLEETSARLNLTEAQKAALQPIFQAAGAQIRALVEDTSLSRREKLRQLQSIRKNTLQQAEAQLTPEQVAEWQKLREERQAEARERRGAARAN